MPTAPTEPETAVIEPSAVPGAPAGGDAPLGASSPHLREGRPSANGAWSSGTRGDWQSALRRRAQASWPTVLIAGVLCFVAFVAGGGLNLSDMTTVEIVLTIGSGLIVAAVALFGPPGERAYGSWVVALLLAFAALTALSVVWSVQPDDSFKDAGRMLAYCGVFGAAVALARAVPARWPAVLGGVVLAASIVCVYALLTKVFPASLDAGDVYARTARPLQLLERDRPDGGDGRDRLHVAGRPARGARAAQRTGLPGDGADAADADARLLARRAGGARARRGAVVLHRAAAPARRGDPDQRRGVRGRGGGVGLLQARAEQRQRGARCSARAPGTSSGVLIVAMLALLTLVGLAFGFWTGRNAPSIVNRRRAGTLLLSVLAVVVLAFAGALAASHRGFTGTISHTLHSVTDPHAPVPSNGPGRLTAVGSVRARYWNEALKVFQAHPVLGAGAEGYATARLRYRTETLDVRHAHGYVVQTLADLGLVGLGLTLALLLVWMAAAGRSTHPFNRRWSNWRTLRVWLDRADAGGTPGWQRLRSADGRPARYTPERVGMLSMLCLVVVFGIHSIDRLDVVRAGQRLCRAALRGLAGGPRAARRGRSKERSGGLAPHDRAGRGQSVERGAGRAGPGGCRRIARRRCVAAGARAAARAPLPSRARAGADRARRGGDRRCAVGGMGAVAAAALGDGAPSRR